MEGELHLKLMRKMNMKVYLFKSVHFDFGGQTQLSYKNAYGELV